MGLVSGPVLRVPEPVMSNEELSEMIGELTRREQLIWEAIRDLEAKQSDPRAPSLRKRVKAWLLARLSES